MSVSHSRYRIYDASAGSGKTFTLVKEYLKIILSAKEDYPFRGILAVTFTNKAVNEMKQRILTSLDKFAQPNCPPDARPLFESLCTELQLSPKVLRLKAQISLKRILHNYAFFDVATIDKFTHRLLRTFAKDLKLSYGFEVVLDTELLLEEAITSLLAQTGDEKKLTQLLVDFAIEKIEDDRSWDIAFDLFQIGKLLFQENHLEHLKKIEGKNIATFEALKKTLRTRVKRSEQLAKQLASEALDLITQAGLSASDFKGGTLLNHFNKILLSEFSPRILYNNQLQLHLEQKKILKVAVAAEKNDVATPLLEHYLKIKKVLYNRAFLKNAYKNIVPLGILFAIQRQVNELLAERDQIPISAFNTIVANEIRDQPTPYIYERLGERYRHYFIDEFQDTSALQWHNLIPLIGNALESEDPNGRRGSLLLVGDAKQAIYRWRGGRAEQFLNLISATNNPFVVSPEVVSLETNFRSRDTIIHFNNHFFKATSPFLHDTHYLQLFEESTQQLPTKKQGGYVQIDYIEPHDEEERNLMYSEHVLKHIEAMHTRGYRYGDMVVLTRKRKQGVTLSDYLMQKGIQVVSAETLLLSNNNQVLFLVNLLKHLLDPSNLEIQYNLLSFLVENKENKHSFIAGNLNSIDTLLLEEYHFDIGIFASLSVYDGMEYAIRQFNLAEGAEAYFMYLLDEVLTLEKQKSSGASEFLEFWEKKKNTLSIAAPENDDAVRIMTIHKAKGLEFPVVIFPFANSRIHEEIAPLLWLAVEKDDFNGFEELLISKTSEVAHYFDIAKEAFENAQYQLELDAFNLLYVALTRAAEVLFVITEKDLSHRKSDLPRKYADLFTHYLKTEGLWQEFQDSYSFGTLDTHKESRSSETGRPGIPFSHSFKDRPQFKIHAHSGRLWGSSMEEALQEGNRLHQLMAQIVEAKDLPHALNTLKVAGFVEPEELSTLRTKAEQIMDHPDLEPFYNKKFAIYNERDIITKNGLLLRPDRVVIQNNKATIIDYKTGKKSAHHKSQLEAYATALQEMGCKITHKVVVYVNEQVTPEFM